RAAVGPTQFLSPVVGRPHDDGVVGDPQLVELGEKLPDMAVVLDHAVGINAEARLAVGLLLEMREDMHSGRIPPAEERCARLGLTCDEVESLFGDLFVNGLLAFSREGASILYPLRTVWPRL